MVNWNVSKQIALILDTFKTFPFTYEQMISDDCLFYGATGLSYKLEEPSINTENKAKFIQAHLHRPLLGVGSCRATFDIDDFALKIILSDDGIEGTYTEAQLYNYLYSKGFTNFLPNLHQYNYHILQQPKGSPIEDFDQYFSQATKIVATLERFGVFCDDLLDNASNWCIYQNSLCICDLNSCYLDN